jgi:hypothetical protein
MRYRPVYLLALFLLLASAAQASDFIYLVTVDTSSLSPDTADIDFQLIPGSVYSQLLNVVVSGFATNGALSTAWPSIGDVSGTLPSNVTFDNGTGLNDYYQDITLGDYIVFSLDLSGPALDHPDPNVADGSTFSFYMSDSTGPILTNDLSDAYAFRVDVGPYGSISVDNESSQTQVQTPEPASLLLMAAPLLIFAARRVWPRAPVSEPRP